MEALARLRNYPTSPRKMRLLVDEIRGLQVEKALALLEHHPQHSSTPLYKLLWSAVKNWELKNESKSAADAGLVVKTIFVDGARVLKRMRELNYQPNLAARSLVTGRTSTLGLVVPDLLHPFFADID